MTICRFLLAILSLVLIKESALRSAETLELLLQSAEGDDRA